MFERVIVCLCMYLSSNKYKLCIQSDKSADYIVDIMTGKF